MSSDIQQVLAIIAIGTVAFFSVLIGGIAAIICFHFPRKCPKCGKYRAFIRTIPDNAGFYTAGGYIVSDNHTTQKVCVSCGFEEKPKLVKKTEGLIKDRSF